MEDVEGLLASPGICDICSEVRFVSKSLLKSSREFCRSKTISEHVRAPASACTSLHQPALFQFCSRFVTGPGAIFAEASPCYACYACHASCPASNSLAPWQVALDHRTQRGWQGAAAALCEISWCHHYTEYIWVPSIRIDHVPAINVRYCALMCHKFIICSSYLSCTCVPFCTHFVRYCIGCHEMMQWLQNFLGRRAPPAKQDPTSNLHIQSWHWEFPIEDVEDLTAFLARAVLVQRIQLDVPAEGCGLALVSLYCSGWGCNICPVYLYICMIFMYINIQLYTLK